MKTLGLSIKVTTISLSIILIWFLVGTNDSAFRYMGF